MGLTGRQLAGALASLGLALGIFWPTTTTHNDNGARGREQESNTALHNFGGGGCPLGFGSNDNNGGDGDGGGDGGGAFHHRKPTSTSIGMRIFTNASFWTGDATVPWAEAMAVTDAGRGKEQQTTSWCPFFFASEKRKRSIYLYLYRHCNLSPRSFVSLVHASSHPSSSITPRSSSTPLPSPPRARCVSKVLASCLLGMKVGVHPGVGVSRGYLTNRRGDSARGGRGSRRGASSSSSSSSSSRLGREVGGARFV